MKALGCNVGLTVGACNDDAGLDCSTMPAVGLDDGALVGWSVGLVIENCDELFLGIAVGCVVRGGSTGLEVGSSDESAL